MVEIRTLSKALALIVLFLLVNISLVPAALAQSPTNSTTVYLPIVIGGGKNGGGGGGGDVNANIFLPYQLGGGIMANRVPQVAVDAAGGIHTVVTANGSDANGQRPAYYAYCAANCTSTANFTTISLGHSMESAQLALDPAGHPRLLLTVNADPQNPRVFQYFYGECNTICTNAANWVLTPILPAGVRSYQFPSDVEQNQSFALDPQGHPGFVFHYKNAPGDAGSMIYAYCDQVCTNPVNWFIALLGDGEWQNPALAFTPTSLPRLAYSSIGYDNNGYVLSQLNYLECTNHCASVLGNLLLTEAQAASSPQAFALRMDSNGYPRLAFYTGGGGGGTLTPDRLYYLACDVNCAQPGAAWTGMDIGLSDQSNGAYGVDLALDRQNRPRIAYHIYSPSLYELGYAWCNANCAAPGAAWNSKILASTAAADQELGHIRYSCPTCYPPIPDCVSFWDAGYWPSLALDGAGNPRIAYEVYLRSGGGCSAETLARFSRLAIFNQP